VLEKKSQEIIDAMKQTAISATSTPIPHRHA